MTLRKKIRIVIVEIIRSPSKAIFLPKRIFRFLRSKSNSRDGREKVAERVAVPENNVLEKMPRKRPPRPSSRAESFENILPIVADKDLKVAAIMDQFTASSFAPECDLLQLTPDYWQQELADFDLDLLFIESAWRGKDDLWGSKVGHHSSELCGIIDACKKRNVPTVFWNKEDPVHFQTFLSTAKLFDVVFTTDVDCVPRYKNQLGHDNVYFLPFACQPIQSNPLELYNRKRAISFAGAYYVKYPDRTADLEAFVDHLSPVYPIEIYDRNYLKDDENHKFPEKYHPLILGSLPFDQIDQAYKGYKYSVNLNSIKQSQSMFARRIFELLASNTLVVSNFSKGLRTMFGDLVIASDSAEQVLAKIAAYESDELFADRVKLAALRKVMTEHTYAHRLQTVCQKVGLEARAYLPVTMRCMGYARTDTELEAITRSFERQLYREKRLLIVHEIDGFPHGDATREYIHVNELEGVSIRDLCRPDEWLCVFSPSDYYSKNYLVDLSLARNYSSASTIGKSSFYSCAGPNRSVELVAPDSEYLPRAELLVRRSIAALDKRHLFDLNAVDFLTQVDVLGYEDEASLSIDRFNYCADVVGVDTAVFSIVKDLDDLQVGLPLDDFLSSETDGSCRDDRPAEVLPDVMVGDGLGKLFGSHKLKKIEMEVSGDGVHLISRMQDTKHQYLYADSLVDIEELTKSTEYKCHLSVSPGLQVTFVLLFFDGDKQRVGHQMIAPNKNGVAKIPAETRYFQSGLRVYGSGQAVVEQLIHGHKSLEPESVILNTETLVLTNNYPDYDDLYRNGFVHSRVKAYRSQGVETTVFRFQEQSALMFREFEGVDVMSGSSAALDKVLSNGSCKNVLVHFLDEKMWQVLRNYVDSIKIYVWVHGSEVQPWWRREYNYASDKALEAAKVASEKRLQFWRNLLNEMPKNLHLIFVSQYFADEVMEDLEIRLPEEKYDIIHNPIDREMFSYAEKDSQQRLKLLSIRPYASAKYANDLTVEMIQLLAKEHFFDELEFRLIGDGILFDELLKPLQKYNNVKIQKGFLRHEEIAALHKQYGIFLCPTRMDAQGVSRDEAMSSGLVPITNRVAAIPEFADDACAILAPADDAKAMADGVKALYNDKELFCQKSKSAALRVARQTDQDLILQRELKLFVNRRVADTDRQDGMLTYFHDKAIADVEVSIDENGMAFVSSLEPDTHSYLYSNKIRLEQLSSLDDRTQLSVVAYASLASLSMAVIFYDCAGAKLAGEIVPCNQSQKLDIPAEAESLSFGIRFFGESTGQLYDIFCGSEECVNEIVARHGSFNGLLIRDQNRAADDVEQGFDTQKPIIVLETVFCDTEKDPKILSRYQSFLRGLFASIVNQSYRNFVWCLFVSSDKQRQIKEITSWINYSSIGSRIKLITYDHPIDGYGFEDDDHIDRARRPNTSIEERRQVLTDMIVSESGVRFEDFEYAARIGIDDDDFISTQYLSEVSRCLIASYQRNAPEERHRVFGFPNIGCAYYRYDGSVDLDRVSMSRAMTGAKFAVSNRAVPMSPFAIHEDFARWEEIGNQNVTYHKVDDNKPGFFYNRHGQNFSNQSKKFFYSNHFGTSKYRSQAEFYRNEVMQGNRKISKVCTVVDDKKYDASLLLLSSKRSSHHAFVEGLLKNRPSYYDNDCLLLNEQYKATKTVQEEDGDINTSVYALSLERNFSLEEILKNDLIDQKLEARSSNRKNVLYLRDPLNTAASTFNIYDKVKDNPSFDFKFVEKNIEHYINLVEAYLSMQDKSQLVFVYSNHFWSDSAYQEAKLAEIGLPEAEYSTKMSFYGGGGNSFFGNKQEVTAKDLVSRFKKYQDNDEFMSLIDNERFYAVSARMLSFVKDEYLLDELNKTLAGQYAKCV